MRENRESPRPPAWLITGRAAQGTCLRSVGLKLGSPYLRAQPVCLCPAQCRRGFATAAVMFSVPGFGGVLLD